MNKFLLIGIFLKIISISISISISGFQFVTFPQLGYKTPVTGVPELLTLGPRLPS